MEKKKILPFLAIRRDPEDIMLNKTNQTQIDK
jgi:hypothetical protein